MENNFNAAISGLNRCLDRIFNYSEEKVWKLKLTKSTIAYFITLVLFARQNIKFIMDSKKIGVITKPKNILFNLSFISNQT